MAAPKRWQQRDTTWWYAGIATALVAAVLVAAACPQAGSTTSTQEGEVQHLMKMMLESNAAIAASVNELKTSVNELKAATQSMTGEVAVLKELVTDLHDSTITLRDTRRMEACAANMSWYLTYGAGCTAFPAPAALLPNDTPMGPGDPVVFLTSSHCQGDFPSVPTFQVIHPKTHYILPYNYKVVEPNDKQWGCRGVVIAAGTYTAQFSPAVLVCRHWDTAQRQLVGNLPNLTTNAVQLQPIMMAGSAVAGRFGVAAWETPERGHLAFIAGKITSYTKELPPGSTGSTTVATMTAEEAESMGYLDVAPLQGMRGGPVLDKQCNVVGMTQGTSGEETGMYTKWTPAVLKRVRKAIIAALQYSQY